jgi:hypothetical protein
MLPHERVHCRCDQHGLVGSHQDRGGKIVGQPRGHLGHQVGGSRRHHKKIGLSRQPDMADVVLVSAVEKLGEHAVGRKRTDRKRCHELLCGRGHHAAHLGAALAQATNQIEALIGSNAAADDQQDAFAGKCHVSHAAHSYTGASADLTSVWTKSSPLNRSGGVQLAASAWEKAIARTWSGHCWSRYW